jgi:carboxypeptidase C (cathepsin A)
VSTVSCDIQSVESIPGDLVGVRTINLNVRSYAGFTNDDKHNHMFGWFFEAQRCMSDDEVANFPLMLWFNGGPGASSMFGAMTENGPYLIQESGLVVQNPYAWNREAHTMYWDNPVGAGYSYNDENEYVTNEDEVGERMYQALQIFFKDAQYKKYQKCALYVTGESYGGKYIPAICNTIRQKTFGPDPGSSIKPADPGDVKINLKGMAIGNPYMDPSLQCVKRLECGLELGFLDTKQYDKLMENVKRLKDALDKRDFLTAFNYNQGIKKDLVACGGNVAIYDVRIWDVDVLGPLVEKYFRLEAVKTALNLPEDQEWNCADETGPVTDHLIEDFMTDSSQESLPPLLHQKDEKGKLAYRVMLYTGNLDMSCGVAGTEEILQKLDWKHGDDWRNKVKREVWASPRCTWPKPPEHKYHVVPGTTKGFVKSCENLTQMVIPRSGHMVPSCRPGVSLEMINTFIHDRKFPTYETPIPDKYPDEREE